jgi:hypothetical protein
LSPIASKHRAELSWRAFFETEFATTKGRPAGRSIFGSVPRQPREVSYALSLN